MKCPKCGEKMYSMGNGGYDTERGNYVEMKYACPKCGYEVSEKSNNLPNYVYCEPLFQPDNAVTNYGWICPKCGAVLSPSIQECPYCTPHKVTCGPNNGSPIKTVPLTDVTTQPQVYKGVNNETNNT